MPTTVYVGNLPYTTDTQTLRAFFEAGGHRVRTVTLVTDPDTGEPRGFAFVRLGTPAEADAAIATLHGRPFEGRSLKVAHAKRRRRHRGLGERRELAGAAR